MEPKNILEALAVIWQTLKFNEMKQRAPEIMLIMLRNRFQIVLLKARTEQETKLLLEIFDDITRGLE